MKKATVRTIASALNLGTATVFRALSGRGPVQNETRSAVLEEARRQGYLPVTQVKRVAVVVSRAFCSGVYDRKLLDSVLKELTLAGYESLIVTETGTGILRHIMFDGILSLCYYGKNNRELAEKLKCPVVGFNTYSNHGLKCYTVNSDESGAIRSAISCFARKGHSRIAAVHMSQRDFSHTMRKKTFLEFAEKLHLKTFFYPRDFDQNFSDLAYNIRKDRVTALLFYYEDQQIPLLRDLQNAGFRIPEDLSVICWEAPGISRVLLPSLTSYGQNFSAMAKRGVRLLQQILEGDTKALEDQKVPYSFYSRNSVAPPGKSMKSP